MSEPHYRLHYGEYKGRFHWDLTKSWLTMTNEQFYKEYGHIYAPLPVLIKKAREYV